MKGKFSGLTPSIPTANKCDVVTRQGIGTYIAVNHAPNIKMWVSACKVCSLYPEINWASGPNLFGNIATKFCMLTELGEQNCYEIHHHPIPAAAPSDFWDPLSTTMRFDLDRPNVNGNTSGRVIF